MSENKKLWRSAFLLVAGACLCLTESLAAQPGRTKLVVHVYNSANVPPSALLETGRYVHEILSRINVDTIWVDETSRPHGVASPIVEDSWVDSSAAHVSLAIVTDTMRIVPHLKNPGIMGWTPAGQSERAYVFYDRVHEFVLKNALRVSGLRVQRIMAYAAAHELGHLLIPSLANGHSDTGIMKARLGPDDIAPTFFRPIGFSSKEGESMRKEVERRILKARSEVETSYVADQDPLIETVKAWSRSN